MHKKWKTKELWMHKQKSQLNKGHSGTIKVKRLRHLYKYVNVYIFCLMTDRLTYHINYKLGGLWNGWGISKKNQLFI